ncbi:hypothetical protein CcaverHIS002_0705110 [Cutaneotrichosporon cavernicola]|uniref:PWI domain-containing protein n=1 Tax=Cutaneotrichosporon cavernicola TaxID=279322 RepID=A0AA48QZ09_9TREE|nr:uncharacterized protein CcaverHIS019_0705170 [Cutaneotrichosporon cavernicola]BEI87165.1 hypothetical protein CcaverHIS002_0705110 [Cutaneotrichosporon cavernicola]BEI94936.1 hypothetical protein CcaverHIS019_0705170 [Cutaneotrichosporon cavernicola]BEJ02710.1 hypothetical protein CcaverHIS631_0705050 [Cutaneotrichosporon cavernicola]BEJ10464.1 hypothetical protein CcaverHIS641_0704990 [Cutaneotrichosporon cavernicola]
MSNGPPPRPPPGMGLPPFRPKFAPGSGAMPPFPPPGFSPNGPRGSASPAGYGPNARGGNRPGYPPPGAGLPPMPSGFPTPPHQAYARTPNHSGPKKDVKTTKIFIGSIAPGISDQVLRELLNACGQLHELKRVEGANGKPQAFGFAMFESPEVVLRCIRCLHGVELPDMTSEGRRNNTTKPLVVKADQKTAEFLKEFEDTLGRSEFDERADEAARNTIGHIVARLTDPNSSFSESRRRGGRHSPIDVHVPAHLRDLKEGDLPETQRVAVLDQIAIFRENAARRERDKKSLEEERERFKTMQARGQPVGYGYGTRAFPKSEVPKGEPSRMREKDPQAYDKPVSFVRPETAEGKAVSERTDEEEEVLRQQKSDRERSSTLREREHRVEKHERQRVEAVMREESVRRQRSENETRNKRLISDDLEHWDDDELEERGKELFYSDKAEWRRQRQQQRIREEEDDIEDRRLEDAEIKALEAESEDFLKQQAAEMAAMEEKQRKKGLLTEDAAPVKLNLSTAKITVPEPKEEKSAPVAKPGVTFGDDEDEDEASAAKKKRTFVKLDYDQIVAEAGIPDEAEVAKQKARLLEITKSLPTSTRSIFRSSVDWSAVQQVMPKIREVVAGGIKDALGEVDEDLAAFAMEGIKEQKGAEDLVDDLSPILADEAEVFVTKLWKQLVFESKAAAQAVDTGSMTV